MLVDRFLGAKGQRLRTEALQSQKLVAGNAALAEELAESTELRELARGDVLIEQDGADNEVYMVLAGALEVSVNGVRVATRGPNDHVGEMAAIQPSQRRSASVTAIEPTVIAAISETSFSELAGRYPQIYRFIAQELARRLLQRNALLGKFRDQIRVFIISSAEALPIARAVQNAFDHDPFVVTIWADGVFRVTNYTLQSLEQQVDNADFAIAIAHADDITSFRGENWPTSRDNVVFELGLFMGRLGRSRAILMEPREGTIKLPSDLAGLTTMTYHFEPGGDLDAQIAPACNRLRDHIVALGANNG
tara:strand:+ start:705 stop:1622 length:918 start_codon:yes stop_codon:yes gene_type:complete